MAVCAANLTLGYFVLDFFPGYSINHELRNTTLFVFDVIKVKNNRVYFTTVYTRMGAQVLAKAFTIPPDGLGFLLCRLFFVCFEIAHIKSAFELSIAVLAGSMSNLQKTIPEIEFSDRLDVSTTAAAFGFHRLESGRRDSNSRRLPWKGNILPLNYSRVSDCNDLFVL